MTIWYKLYTDKRIDCPWCIKARELLQVYGIDYKEFDVSEPGVKEMFSEKGLRTVPQVFRESQHIGGYNALEHFLREEQKQIEKEKRHGKARVITTTA